MEEECEVCHGTDPRCEDGKQTWGQKLSEIFSRYGKDDDDSYYLVHLQADTKHIIQQEIDKATQAERRIWFDAEKATIAQAEHKGWVSAQEDLDMRVTNIRQEERTRILKLIEPYIENGKKAIAEGGMSQFGSASGSMMAKSALEAFEELKNKIIHDCNEMYATDLEKARLALLSQIQEKLKEMERPIIDIDKDNLSEEMAYAAITAVGRDVGYNLAIKDLTSYLKELE